MIELTLPEQAGSGGVLEIVDAFDERALAVAASAAAPKTCQAYATSYRLFAAFLRARYGEASLETFTLAAVAGWRDELTAQGPRRARSRSACRPCGAWPRRSAPTRSSPRCAAPTSDMTAPARSPTWSSPRCLRGPDLRTTIGTRARAILEVLARVGLRRSELARLTLNDVQRGRQPDKRRRAAIALKRGDQTPLEVVLRGSKRGRTRTVPLHAEAHDALRRWYAARPPALTDALFLSLRKRRSATPEPLSAGAFGDIVTRHATAAGVHEDRRTAHALRHTFCTTLAERGVALEVIRALAGHVDVRTTQIYVDVTARPKASRHSNEPRIHSRPERAKPRVSATPAPAGKRLASEWRSDRPAKLA